MAKKLSIICTHPCGASHYPDISAPAKDNSDIAKELIKAVRDGRDITLPVGWKIKKIRAK